MLTFNKNDKYTMNFSARTRKQNHARRDVLPKAGRYYRPMLISVKTDILFSASFRRTKNRFPHVEKIISEIIRNMSEIF